MGHLQKTPVGLARRILNFNEDVAAAAAAAAAVAAAGPLQSAGFPIQTIMEGNDEATTANQNAPLVIAAPVVAQGGRPAAKTPLPSGGQKPTEPVSSRLATKSADDKTIRAASLTAGSKPVKTWKVGKAGKNAANSQVQSLGNGTRLVVVTATTTTTTSSSSGVTTSTKVVGHQQQSWAQRLQAMPKFDLSQPQSKSVRPLNGPKPSGDDKIGSRWV